MTDDIISRLKSSGPPITPVSEIGAPATKPPKPKSDELGQQEFLTLLVHQLQSQDPLNPMESEEFAVQLAQFSQLERLVSIDKKLGEANSAGSDPIATMASYLGHEVILKDQSMNVRGEKGSNLIVNVPPGTQSIRVDLTDESGAVIARHSIDDVNSGSQLLSMDGVNAPDGKYSVRVVSVDANGQFVELDAKVTGTVEGFVLEPEPMLLVNGEQVALQDVSEVRVGKA